MISEQEFKSLRHRFYKLGKNRNIAILQELGKIRKEKEDSRYLLPGHDEMKDLLTQLVNEGRAYDLIEWIKFHEDQIQKEKDEML